VSKQRILYILYQHPQLSETYSRAEIDALADDFELEIISLTPADFPYSCALPFKLLSTREEIQAEIDRFRPHVIHTHWIHTHLDLVIGLARENGIPFTVRSHSFDTLFTPPNVPPALTNALDALNGDLCLGVLAMPFAVRNLVAAGLEASKIREVFPVVDYRAFLDRGPNGSAVINVGAALPKKKYEDFIALGAAVPDLEFNLYAIGYHSAVLNAVNEAHGNPVNILPPVDPSEMPAVYKRHGWLVVTGSKQIGTVGWPLCIAEAQASGVGVCVPNLREDVKDYVGEAGFFYDSIYEVADIISRPYPQHMREAGFEQARKSDIRVHIQELIGLWELAARPV
jgi:hypothetical protein